MILILAWRNIWRNRWRSLVISFSVIIGMLAGVFVLSLYEGMLKARIQTVVYRETGHIQIHLPEFKNDNDPAFVIPSGEEVCKWLSQRKETGFLSARTKAQGMLQTASGTAGVLILGIDAEAENRVSSLKDKIMEGRGFFEKGGNEIIIGKKLAAKLKTRLGSRVVLTFADSSGGLVSGAFRIRGIYQSENSVLDESNVYVSGTVLGEMLLTHQGIHEISVLLKQDEWLDASVGEIKSKYPGLLVESWKELSPETELMVTSVDYYSLILLGIIFLALAFGILNTMLMAVLERSREIGMMMALGAGRVRIFLMILFETSFLALTGLPVGLGLGHLIIGYLHSNGLDLSGFGKEMLSGFGFSPVIYPEFPEEKLPVILLMVFVTTLISGLPPAFRALRLRPVETLKI